MQHEGHLDVLVQPRVAAREHHPELVVLERVGKKERLEPRPQRPLAFDKVADLRGEFAGGSLPAKHVDRAVLGGGRQERGVVLRHALVAPRFERVGERLLNDVLREGEVLDAKRARERSQEARCFPSKEGVVRLH